MNKLLGVLLSMAVATDLLAQNVTLKASRNPTSIGDSTGLGLEANGIFSNIFDGNEHCGWRIRSSDGTVDRTFTKANSRDEKAVVWASFNRPGKVRIEAQPTSLGCEYQEKLALELTVLDDYSALDLHVVGTLDAGHKGPIKAIILRTEALDQVGSGIDRHFSKYLPPLLKKAIKLDPRGAQIREVVYQNWKSDSRTISPDAETIYIMTRDLMEILEIEWDSDRRGRYQQQPVWLIDKYLFDGVRSTVVSLTTKREQEFQKIEAAWRSDQTKFAAAKLEAGVSDDSNWCRIEARRDKPWLDAYLDSARFKEWARGYRMGEQRVISVAPGEAPVIKKEDKCQIIVGRTVDLLRSLRYWDDMGYPIYLSELQGEADLLAARAKLEGFASVEDMQFAWLIPDGYYASQIPRLRALGLRSGAELEAAIARLRSKNYTKTVDSADLLHFLEDERDGAKAGMSATAWRDKRVKEQQQAQLAAAKAHAKKYPYRAEFECRYGQAQLPMVNCLLDGRGGYVEVTQGAEQKSYGWQDFQAMYKIELQPNFRMKILNGGNDFMIRIVIKDNLNNAVKAERLVRPHSALMLTP